MDNQNLFVIFLAVISLFFNLFSISFGFFPDAEGIGGAGE